MDGSPRGRQEQADDGGEDGGEDDDYGGGGDDDNDEGGDGGDDDDDDDDDGGGDDDDGGGGDGGDDDDDDDDGGGGVGGGDDDDDDEDTGSDCSLAAATLARSLQRRSFAAETLARCGDTGKIISPPRLPSRQRDRWCDRDVRERPPVRQRDRRRWGRDRRCDRECTKRPLKIIALQYILIHIAVYVSLS